MPFCEGLSTVHSVANVCQFNQQVLSSRKVRQPPSKFSPHLDCPKSKNGGGRSNRMACAVSFRRASNPPGRGSDSEIQDLQRRFGPTRNGLPLARAERASTGLVSIREIQRQHALRRRLILSPLHLANASRTLSRHMLVFLRKIQFAR